LIFTYNFRLLLAIDDQYFGNKDTGVVMNQKNIFIISIILLGSIIININAQDVIPQLINYQGFITDKDGKALSGDFTVVFSLYNRLEGGDPLWQETHAGISVENGLLNVMLGSVDSTLSLEILSGIRYVGIKVDDGNELSPRMRLASVPYSMQSEKSTFADSATYALKATKANALDAPDGDPENAVYVDNDGNTKIAGRVKDKTGFIIPVGSILPFAGDSTFIGGWLVCDGSEISRTDYADLFKVIGITYGGGDGVSTFNLPNLKGRIPVGLDEGQAEFNAKGKTGGENEHTLTITEMPTHNHNEGNFSRLLQWTGTGTTGSVDNTTYEPNIVTFGTIQPAGGGQAHNNLQPYIVMNYIIKY